MLNMLTPTKHTRIKATEVHRDQNYFLSISVWQLPTCFLPHHSLASPRIVLQCLHMLWRKTEAFVFLLQIEWMFQTGVEKQNGMNQK